MPAKKVKPAKLSEMPIPSVGYIRVVFGYLLIKFCVTFAVVLTVLENKG